MTRVYTGRAVIDIQDRRFVLREKLPSVGLDQLQALTGAKLHLAGPVGDIVGPEI